MSEPKKRKTFPLELGDSLHKALKIQAIESEMTLHAYILEALELKVRENAPAYETNLDGRIDQREKGKQ
jgi:predicted HicB family RNase H-like nuclease